MRLAHVVDPLSLADVRLASVGDMAEREEPGELDRPQCPVGLQGNADPGLGLATWSSCARPDGP